MAVRPIIRLVGIIPRSEITPFTVLIAQDDATGDCYVTEYKLNREQTAALYGSEVAPTITWQKIAQVFEEEPIPSQAAAPR